MDALLTITHFGTPIIWVSETALSARFHGPLVTDIRSSVLHIRGPSDSIAINLASELTHGLEQLAGFWFVVTTIGGDIRSAEAVPLRGRHTAEVLDLFPDDRRPIAASMRSDLAHTTTLDALDDGIFLCGKSRLLASISCPGLPAFLHQARQGLRRYVEGVDSARYGQVFLPGLDAREGVAEDRRLSAAISRLDQFVLDEAPVERSLLELLSRVQVRWSPCTKTELSSMRWGWDPASRLIAMPSDLDPELDAAHLAVGLYHAWATINGNSIASSLVNSMYHGSKALHGGARKVFIREALVEALGAQRLAAAIARQGRLRVGGLTNVDIAAVAEHAARLFDFARVSQADWFDVRRRILIPRPESVQRGNLERSRPSLFSG